MLFLLQAVLLAQSPQSPQSPPPPPVASEARLAVEVLDPKGVPKTDLKPGDLSVSEGGESRRVLAVEPIGQDRPWRVVVYVDRMLSSTRTMRGAGGALAAQARELVALGPVELVVAEPEPRVVLGATRDAAAVDEALSRLFLMGEGRDDLRALRQKFTEEAGSPAPDDLQERIGEAVTEEVRLAGRQQDFLLEWLAEGAAEGPRVLFLVSDGFEPAPAEFYLGRVANDGARAELARALEAETLQGTAEETARAAAELGWTVLPLPVGDERLPELNRWRPTPSEQVPVQITVTPGRRKKPDEPERPAPPVLLRAKEPLAWLAQATGGEVVTSSPMIAPAVARLRSRLWLRYESPAPASGAQVEVRAGNRELSVRAPRWAGSAAPEGVSAMRARRLLEGEELEGELKVAAVLHVEEPAEGTRTARLELRLAEPSAAPGPLRLTLAMPAGESRATIVHRELPAAERSEDGAWRIDLPLPADTERLALLVDDTGRHLWGGEVLDVRPEDEAAGEDEIAGEHGEAVLRPEPRRWTGRGVRIVRPEGGRAVGPVDVEVEVRLPPDRRLERLEIFWNEELAATLYGPPFRERVTIPPSRQVGYLRAAARLDDGSTAEDAVLLNASVMGERLEVRLVELYVVVTDRDGRPVTGLSRNDFRLLQDGREQEISGFDDAGESPLLLGLAFDSSASMFLKLPDVQKAARGLLAGSLSRKDRALLVDFDTEPRLVVGATGNLSQVSAGLRALHADGGSNLFEAVLFSLEQLGRLSGRRALIVYSDGIGEGEKGYRSCLRAARKSGLPVYLIVTNTRAARNAGGGLLADFDSYAAKLERLAAASGGRAYFVQPSQDLGGVYQEILRELRSQYLLTYYPRDASPEVWRKVGVELKKRGLRARTVSGYYGK